MKHHKSSFLAITLLCALCLSASAHSTYKSRFSGLISYNEDQFRMRTLNLAVHLLKSRKEMMCDHPVHTDDLKRLSQLHYYADSFSRYVLLNAIFHKMPETLATSDEDPLAHGASYLIRILKKLVRFDSSAFTDMWSVYNRIVELSDIMSNQDRAMDKFLNKAYSTFDLEAESLDDTEELFAFFENGMQYCPMASDNLCTNIYPVNSINPFESLDPVLTQDPFLETFEGFDAKRLKDFLLIIARRLGHSEFSLRCREATEIDANRFFDDAFLLPVHLYKATLDAHSEEQVLGNADVRNLLNNLSLSLLGMLNIDKSAVKDIEQFYFLVSKHSLQVELPLDLLVSSFETLHTKQ